jgi:hypothetical protein
MVLTVHCFELDLCHLMRLLIDLGGGPERANLSFKSFDTQCIYEADGSHRLRTTRIGGEGGSCPSLCTESESAVRSVRGAFSAWCVQCKQKEEEGEKRNPKKARGQRGEVSMPTGVLIPYAPPGADSVLEASVEKGGHMCTESESAVRSACGGDRRQRKNASRRGKKRNPKKTQRVDGGAVNAVRTTGSGQRVGGVCGEELTKGFLELYVCKSRRRRGLLGTSHLECV